jgi:hypothetical protein
MVDCRVPEFTKVVYPAGCPSIDTCAEALKFAPRTSTAASWTPSVMFAGATVEIDGVEGGGGGGWVPVDELLPLPPHAVSIDAKPTIKRVQQLRIFMSLVGNKERPGFRPDRADKDSTRYMRKLLCTIRASLDFANRWKLNVANWITRQFEGFNVTYVRYVTSRKSQIEVCIGWQIRLELNFRFARRTGMIAGMSFVSARTFNVELITKDAMNAIDSRTFSFAHIA